MPLWSSTHRLPDQPTALLSQPNLLLTRACAPCRSSATCGLCETSGQGASALEQQTLSRGETPLPGLIIGDDSSSLSGGGGKELPWWLPLLLLLCLPACLLGAKKRQKMKRAHVEDDTDLGLGAKEAAPTKKPSGSRRESSKRSNRGSVYGATVTESNSIRLEEVDTQRLSSCSPGLPDDWNKPLDEHDTAARASGPSVTATLNNSI